MLLFAFFCLKILTLLLLLLLLLLFLWQRFKSKMSACFPFRARGNKGMKPSRTAFQRQCFLTPGLRCLLFFPQPPDFVCLASQPSSKQPEMLHGVSKIWINTETVADWASAQCCLISMQEACQNIKRKKQWEGDVGEDGAAVEPGSFRLSGLDVDPMWAEAEGMGQTPREG